MSAKPVNSIAAQIVAACRPSPLRNVFCIGSFGQFVNFNAQQHRALNLAWALADQKSLDQTQPVAIIGGGLTGITIATALVTSRFEVDLFEGRKELMAHQLSTDHRLVHPSINRWPLVPMMPSSSLPFLNWVSGPCSKVATGILHEFEDLAARSTNLQVQREIEISDIDDGIDGLLLSHRGKPVAKSYGAAILTVGFGEEKTDDKFPAISYWHPDGIEHQTLTENIEYFLVSGCGDGGLIDALRVIHRDFDKGGLVFETAYSLDDTPVSEMIKEIIEGGRGPGQQQAYLAAAKLIGLDVRYENVHKRLQRSAGESRPVVRLSARGPDPFSGNAAPIHKLMIAHAMLSRRAIYQQGTLALDDRKIKIGRKSYSTTNAKVVVRHGPTGEPISRFCTKEEIDVLKSSQEALEDLLSVRSWAEPYPGSELEALASKAERLHRQAVRAIKLVCPEAAVTHSKRGFTVVLPEIALARRIPHELFGIPVKTRITRNIRRPAPSGHQR